MTAIARKIQERGHDVVCISTPDAASAARAANLNFVSFCEEEFPDGSVDKQWSELAKLRGLDVVKYAIQNLITPFCKAGLDHLEETLTKAGVEAVAFDSTYRLLELVPMRLGMPYVHLWCTVHADLTGLTPPYYFNWPYDPSPEGIARNKEGSRKIAEFGNPVRELGIAYAEKMGLQIDWSNPYATTSKLAIVSQIPREFDFPNPNLPPQFRYTGPFHDDKGRKPIPFPWEKLTGAPLIYASMGTLVNGLEHVYRKFLKVAEKPPDMQMVLSIGRNVKPADLGPIPSNAIVISSAPQIELLKRATLCITHAGLNTALESLAQGVPMVAIPIGFDQPGVASRIAHHGAGEFLDVDAFTEEDLFAMVQKIRTDPGYKDKALYFQDVITKTRGLDVAADVIEAAFGKALIHAEQASA